MAGEHRRLEPAEFQRCIAVVTHKVEALAVRLGMLEAGRLDLESTLSDFPPSSRGRHAGIMLDGLRFGHRTKIRYSSASRRVLRSENNESCRPCSKKAATEGHSHQSDHGTRLPQNKCCERSAHEAREGVDDNHQRFPTFL
jgi:hypothetical protein